MVEGRHQVQVTIDLSAGTSDGIDSAYEKLKKLEEIKKSLEETITKEEKLKGREYLERQFGIEGGDELSEVIQQAIIDDIEEAITSEQKPQTIEQSEFDSFVKNLDASGLSTLQQLTTNPAGFIQTLAFSGLGKAAQFIPILGLLTTALSTPQVIRAIILKLSELGGPFNRDWRRYVQREIDGGIRRELQKLSEKGLTTDVFTQQRGFLPNNVNWTHSNLYSVTEDRLRRAGMDDRAYGVTI